MRRLFAHRLVAEHVHELREDVHVEDLGRVRNGVEDFPQDGGQVPVVGFVALNYENHRHSK